MHLALVAVGRVGGLLVDALVAQDRRLGGGLVAGAVAVDTALADLESLRFVPAGNRVAVGAEYPSRAGVDGDNELGASIAAEDLDSILAGIDCIPTHRADAFLVVSALGGGTGGGGAPVIARHLSHLFSRPVYGVGILPPDDADDQTAYNAVRSLVTFVREVDNLVLTEVPDDQYAADGTGLSTVAGRLATVFGNTPPTAGLLPTSEETAPDTVTEEETEAVVDGGEPSTAADLVVAATPVVTLSSVLATGGLSLLCGTTHVSQQSVLERLWPGHGATDDDSAPTPLVSVVRDAAFGRQPVRSGRWSVEQSTETLPAVTSPPSAETAWLVVSGPRHALSGEAVDGARQWLHDETCARVVGGYVTPTARSTLTSTLLLSGVQHVPRLDRLWARATELRPSGGGAGRLTPPALSGPDAAFDPLF